MAYRQSYTPSTTTDWNLLVRHGLPKYLRHEKRLAEKALDEKIAEEEAFPTIEQVQENVTMEELRLDRKNCINRIHEIEEAMLEPVKWLLDTKRVKEGLAHWTSLRNEIQKDVSYQVVHSERYLFHILKISMACGEVFRAAGLHLTVAQRRHLREHLPSVIHKYRAPVGAEDTFSQMGLIWDSFKTKFPDVPDTRVYDALVHHTTSHLKHSR